MLNYDKNALEFDLFLSELSGSFVSNFASEYLQSFEPKPYLDAIIERQNGLAEVLELFAAHGTLSVEPDRDFYLLLKRLAAKPDISDIEPSDYIHTALFLENAETLKEETLKKAARYPSISILCESLNIPKCFVDVVTKTFDGKGELKDTASDALFALRKKIGEVKIRVSQALKSIFARGDNDKFIQERVITLRSGRYTIPCKTNFSQYIKAIIFDRSASGQTLYIEPLSVVEINNELQERLSEEGAETAKILALLREQFLALLPTFTILAKEYAELAFRLETARFYLGRQIVFPKFGTALSLVDIHHPLLKLAKEKNSIPLTIKLERGERVIVISGPNTGGKTAALKSLGLNHLIALCGLPVFAQHATMFLSRSIRADIGDKQSLTMDLSTFSAHMENIKGIITEADEGDLALFDELGTGTDPREGAALAISILGFILRKGAYAVLTTHFSEVKAFAFASKEARLYAVDFDYNTFEPRYRLLSDTAGKSDPVLIAKRLGFPQEVLDETSARITEIKSSVEAEFEELHLLRAETAHLHETLKRREDNLMEREGVLKAREDELDNKLAKRELDLLEESVALLRKSKRLAEERVRKHSGEIDNSLEEAEAKLIKLKARRKPMENLGAGDSIYLERYSKTAKILSIDEKNAILDLEGIRVKMGRGDLIGYKTAVKEERKVKISKATTDGGRNELILVGKRVEEALDILEKYIDKAINSGYSKVYIVHGRGSGQLRRAVREYLRASGVIAGFAPATSEEGGEAVTVVSTIQ